MKKRVKVGVITIWDIDNYGNRLQNYALLTIIKKLGYDSYTLKVWPQSYLKRAFQYITNYDVSILRILKERLEGNVRKANFLLFEKKNIPKDRRFYNCKYDKKLLNKKYSIIVVGSDQIWHPVFLKNKNFFPTFANSIINTISYAASIGVSQLNEVDKVNLRDGLRYIKHISVRETQAASIISDLGMNTPEVVLDPTMLIDKNEWSNLEIKPSYAEKKYLLVYFLGEISEERLQLIDKISKEYQLQIITLGDRKYSEIYTAGPAEFLFLFHHATLIFTDSFHGCVFSILFNSPFYVFSREDRLENMSSRIDTLLAYFNLQNRIVDDVSTSISLTYDFTLCDKQLLDLRAKSINFLKTALLDSNNEV